MAFLMNWAPPCGICLLLRKHSHGVVYGFIVSVVALT